MMARSVDPALHVTERPLHVRSLLYYVPDAVLDDAVPATAAASSTSSTSPVNETSSSTSASSGQDTEFEHENCFGLVDEDTWQRIFVHTASSASIAIDLQAAGPRVLTCLQQQQRRVEEEEEDQASLQLQYKLSVVRKFRRLKHRGDFQPLTFTPTELLVDLGGLDGRGRDNGSSVVATDGASNVTDDGRGSSSRFNQFTYLIMPGTYKVQTQLCTHDGDNDSSVMSVFDCPTGEEENPLVVTSKIVARVNDSFEEPCDNKEVAEGFDYGEEEWNYGVSTIVHTAYVTIRYR